MPPLLRLVHPAPAAAVVALSAALAGILSGSAGRQALDPSVALVTLSVAGSQILAGALNEWADRDRDALAQPEKPIPAGLVTPRAAFLLALGGAVLLMATSAPLGMLPLLLGATAAASAVAYDVWLSRTPLSVLPFVVSFGILPAWIAAGVDVPIERVSGAILLVGPFAAAAHLSNALRDFDADRAAGSRNLAQVLGRGRAWALALGLGLGVGIGVGISFVRSGDGEPVSLGLAALGLAALVVGATGSRRLWVGMLLAALCWTVAWGLSTS